MARTVTLNGTAYSVPEPGDTGYDSGLTSYLVAIATAFPQLGNSGTQALTAELDLGGSFGLKALYLKTETATPATAGVVRLAKTDAVKWRNNANNADLALGMDTADALTFGTNYVTGNPMLGASTAAGQSITSGSFTIIVFGTVEVDSDSGYNAGTGRYTIPAGKGGDYQIVAAAAYNGALTTSTVLSIYKNATEVKRVTAVNPGAGSALALGALLRLVAGDVIDIRTLQTSGSPAPLVSTAAANYFALKRITT